MFRKLNKNRKGQNTAEYALLISLVVAAIIAMQTYAQRTLQARIRDAAVYLSNVNATLGTTTQYEPYYLQSNYSVDRKTSEVMLQNTSFVGMNEDSNRVRLSGGFQSSNYIGITGE
jgi:Flp pilus assembly pilin Flp